MINKLLVYTALFTDDPNYLYGDIIHYTHDKGNVDYICYTNSDYIDTDFWDIRKYNIHRNGRWTARLLKTKPHEFFGEYDAWLWMDNEIYFTVDPLELANYYLDGYDMAVHTHSDRNCIYQESQAAINRGGELRDSIDTITGQSDEYRNDGYPAMNGLYENGILFRRNNKQVVDFNNKWYSETWKWNTEDQISFAYSLWKLNNIKLNVINKTFIAHNPQNNLEKTNYFYTLPRQNRYVAK